MKRWLTITVPLTIFLASCTTATLKPVDPTNLKDLETLSQKTTKIRGANINKIRADAIKEVSMTIGAQGGLAWRSEQINKMVGENQKELSQIFNFNGLLLENNIMPPVIQESKQSLQLNSPNIIRISNRTYKIIKQARFVTTPPTWRNYLSLNYPKPDLPDRTLLPRNQQEREIWIKFVNIGWQKGIEQANNIYANNLAKLKRDFEGMLLYRKMLSQNMVSKPFVAKSAMGITSNDDNSEIRINDRILRITSAPTINPNSKEWKPVMVQR